ncbi:hypothetical protein FA95DRAFT_1217842 [Auriscalpium vulgare]|uniref:Uncharacterized protein n=1 Tax=Auriscalpium vulgare TaxID=40419 RepID=A0ACB8RV58_9AGAM|nr:hypothetical protein FA95DRAFT_1217842 [Auriscalpium vulgare]
MSSCPAPAFFSLSTTSASSPRLSSSLFSFFQVFGQLHHLALSLSQNQDLLRKGQNGWCPWMLQLWWLWPSSGELPQGWHAYMLQLYVLRLPPLRLC